MTRGTGYLITDDTIYFHDEFNGDMYPDGYGVDFIKMLSKTTAKNFDKKLNDWNSSNHNYEDFKTIKMSLKEFKPVLRVLGMNEHLLLNFNEDYYNWFFSDWIFIKNASPYKISVWTKDNKKVVIRKGATYAFHFGSSENHYTSTKARIKKILDYYKKMR